MKDKLIWPKEKNGVYTVKSGYHTKKNSSPLRPQISASSSHMIDNKVWSFIWNIKTPPRVKHFLWRASSKAIATRPALKQRKIAQEATCPICHDMDESMEHLILQCPWVETVWFGSMDHVMDKRSITLFDR
ncbi:hypothetical protein COLO4_34121 [Corchorus olitorius]|uniref:Reverse transcriptase zinc-binding domain-containing protein n=1 Tax=Corchorus olitorius TaxID=93759 RepID=A0A1R3GNI6_9ROSI|nr:hypothetical protein COLO4_34121 [Corchorus olitorius]